MIRSEKTMPVKLAGIWLVIILLAACTAADSAPTAVVPTPTFTQSVEAPSSTPQIPQPTPTLEPTEMIPTEPGPPIDLINPDFESDSFSGWESNAPANTVVEEGGYEGGHRLTQTGDTDYQVETVQQVTGLADGWYTLRAWVRSSGGQNAAYIALACDDDERRAYIPSTLPGYRWLNVVASLEVTGGACEIRLVSDARAGNWVSYDHIELLSEKTTLTILGADISSLKKSEDFGGVYRDTDGEAGDALAILSAHGLNYARLRVWVDPADGYHSKDSLLAVAGRLHEQGIKLLVDFHYSDNWADPGKQNKPAAWEDLDFDSLVQAVYDHTYEVCSALVEQGTPPDMVQVGNEINAGMLWPDGSYEHFDNLAALLKSGIQAVKDCAPETRIMLHIAEGGDNELAKWWFGNITGRDVPFDVIGISYYPFWHGTFAELQFNLNDISARYDKDVVVVETAYAFTAENGDFLPNIFSPEMEIGGYPLTPGGQAAFLRDLMDVVRAVPDHRGLGVFWWDATWIAVAGNGWDNTDPASGNAWENQALFGYDGVVLPALDEFLLP